MKRFHQLILILLLISFNNKTHAQSYDLEKALSGFDEYIEQVMKDWNTPGLAVGIIIKNKLVYSKGFGYRDIENKLPVTPNTLFPIASNTKLFTSVSLGMLVEEGKLSWDKPISKYVPQIKFYNQELYNNVTLRDMLSHRTGISRHDFIWYKSDFSRKELYDRLVFLEPAQPLRQSSLYNNLMYAASGYILELLSGETWEVFVQDNILNPLSMNSTLFTIEDMETKSDFAFPYYEDRKTDKLVKRPFYREQQGIGPAGAIISNIEDMSKWVITLMNQGNYKSKNVISSDILKETLQPTIAYPNISLENKGYTEIFNRIYGMGREFAAYKGHYLTSHGGAIGGIYSQVSMMPYDSIGVLVFVNGAHNYPLVNFVSYNIYDRLLGLYQTDFNGRSLKNRIEAKKASREAKKNVDRDKITNTKPSHAIIEYQGQYENPAYGILNIELNGNDLIFNFHNIKLPLKHYHYDRFDTPDDQIYGKYSVNFSINPQGEISNAIISLDELEVSFLRKPDTSLSNTATLKKYEGSFELAGRIIKIKMSSENKLIITISGQPTYTLIPYKSKKFKLKEFSDYIIEFVMEGDEVKKMKVISPNGIYDYVKK